MKWYFKSGVQEDHSLTHTAMEKGNRQDEMNWVGQSRTYYSKTVDLLSKLVILTG